MKRGDRVRLVGVDGADTQYGAVAPGTEGPFVRVVPAGFVGTLHRKHPVKTLAAAGWWIVRVEIDGDNFDVPAWPGHFAVLS